MTGIQWVQFTVVSKQPIKIKSIFAFKCLADNEKPWTKVDLTRANDVGGEGTHYEYKGGMQVG